MDDARGRGAGDEPCDHPDVVLDPESAPDDADYDAAPYGRILQEGICRRCAARVERNLRPSGWGAWYEAELG
jgi:hypothetical protein